jgi:Tfp pilus assembly protein PilF
MSNVRFIPSKTLSLALSVAVSAAVGLFGNAAIAGDPFRSSNARPIGDRTESALEAIFVEGNYPKASTLVTDAIAQEPNEPLAYAMAAALAYSNQDWEGLKPHARNTIAAAEKLMARDPLRGNIYMAVGHFIEGSYTLKTQGRLVPSASCKKF